MESSLAKLAQISHLDLPTMLKHLRKRRNLSARDLSLKSGLSSSYVSKVEAGNIKPTIEAFARMIDHLGVTDQEIVFIIRTLNGDK